MGGVSIGAPRGFKQQIADKLLLHAHGGKQHC
jgi:hypothetical protein